MFTAGVRLSVPSAMSHLSAGSPFHLFTSGVSIMAIAPSKSTSPWNFVQAPILSKQNVFSKLKILSFFNAADDSHFVAWHNHMPLAQNSHRIIGFNGGGKFWTGVKTPGNLKVVCTFALCTPISGGLSHLALSVTYTPTCLHVYMQQ